MMMRRFLLLVGGLPWLVHGILPTGQLTVNPSNGPAYTLLASQASFGPLSPMARPTDTPRKLVLAPSSNALLCDNVTATDGLILKDSVVVVPRGECTYQSKTWHAQQLGAVGVVLYNTLSSRYSINTTNHQGEKYPNYSTKDIIFPQQYFDYDCSKGQAMIPAVDLTMHPLPYNAPHNDPLLSGDTSDNLCRLHSSSSDNFASTCASERCLITSWDENATQIKACCAWDLHLWLYSDTTLKDVDIKIPTVFLKMKQADQLLASMASTEVITGMMASRWRSDYNLSSIIIWIMGVCVAALAAFYSAKDYHQVLAKLRLQRQRSCDSSSVSSQQQQRSTNNRAPMVTRSPMQEDTLELEPIHALGFVIMASTSLFILFYFKIYNVVKVMYAIGCSNAVVQVITYPLVSKILKKTQAKPKLLYHSSEFGDITNWDVLAGMLGYLWGMTWLYMALVIPHPDQYTFFWVTQDVLGTCICIAFLGLIQLNSIQVASILLVVAFVYDIFFVFVTPYIFNKSIMITVATSGGPPTADPLWCEKYPSDADCQGGDPLPMLLTVPRILDYQGGSSLLGLGDIVLPGLLLSFAARLDAAKALVGMMSGGRQVVSSVECQSGAAGSCLCCCKRNGGYYFVPVVVAYAVGLLMANIAVYVMNMGQPALLYLVPCTLGTMAILAWRRQELRSLWDGPSVLRTADEIVYGIPPPQRQSSTASRPTTTTSTEETSGADDEEEGPEEMEDDEGDVPLLQSSAANPK